MISARPYQRGALWPAARHRAPGRVELVAGVPPERASRRRSHQKRPPPFSRGWTRQQRPRDTVRRPHAGDDSHQSGVSRGVRPGESTYPSRVRVANGAVRKCLVRPHVGSITASSGLESSFLEADGTRSTQDVRRPWTKCSSDSQNRMSIRCAQWNASRDDAWRRRRVAVARPVRIAFCTNLRFSLTFWRLTAHVRRKMCGVRGPNAAAIRRTACRYGVRNGTLAATPPGDVDASLSCVLCDSLSAPIFVFSSRFGCTWNGARLALHRRARNIPVSS